MLAGVRRGVNSNWRKVKLCAGLTVLLVAAEGIAAESIKLGLNYPSTGRYKEQGLMQARGALMAIEEINAQGGLLNRPLELLRANTAFKADRAVQNVNKLADQGAAMLFGGVSSAVAIAAGKEAAKRGLIYFGTLTYSNTTTGEQGHRHMFRESYNAWMASKALGKYVNENLAGKKLFYISSDRDWGRTTEASLRRFTNTTDTKVHQGVRTRFPNPRDGDFKKALDAAKAAGAEVLMLVQFGDNLARILDVIHRIGMRDQVDIIVPGLTLGMARAAGAGIMEGVIGAVPWSWQVPYKYEYPEGKKFVEKFLEKYQTYPSSSAASAYSIVYQYKSAVERSRSLKSAKVIKALENHSYTGLKDQQTWRNFDHQNVQSVYVVRSKPRHEILTSNLRQDFFEVLMKLPAEQAPRTKEEWLQVRKQAGKREVLQ